MLSRVIRVPLKYRFSAAAKPENNLPEIKNKTKDLKQWKLISQQKNIHSIEELAINFQPEVDGKKLILLAIPQDKPTFKLSDLTTAALTISTAFTVLSNFNYLLTLACGGAAVASMAKSVRLSSARSQNRIIAIEVDRDQRLHVTLLNNSEENTLIVDKKDFVYNILKGDKSGSESIWCKINNSDYWIPREKLQINNQQLHHLL